MTNPEKKKAVLYAREVPEPEPDPERFIYILDKWDGLEKALGADADVLFVSFPEVLGDTYTEPTHGTPLAPPLGVYVWSWLVAFTVLLGSAHILAAALGTPGCEMRSYAHLSTLLLGGDTKTVECPGGIDRLDHIGAKTQPSRATDES